MVSLSLLYFLTRDLQYEEIRSSFRRADWSLAGLALISVIVNTLAKAIRWKVLLGSSGRIVSFLRLLGALIVGQMLNLLFPARLGDLGRSYSVGTHGPGVLFTLGTVMLEKLVDMLTYSLISIAVLFLIPLPAFVQGPARLLVLITGVIVFAGTGLMYSRPALRSMTGRLLERLPERLQAQLAARLRSVAASLSILKRRRDLAGLAFWTVLIWGTAILNNHLMLLALGIDVPITASLLLLVVLQAGISVSTVPASIGIFEYLCVVALSLFNVDQAQALSFGVLLHAVVMLPIALAGLPVLAHFALGSKRGPSRGVAAPDGGQ